MRVGSAVNKDKYYRVMLERSQKRDLRLENFKPILGLLFFVNNFYIYLHVYTPSMKKK